MKSFVVMTYYQLMHATAMTLELGEKTNIYFIWNYLKVSDEFLDRVRDTGIFNLVVKLDQEENMGPYHAAMDNTIGLSDDEIDKIGNSIFEKYLEPYYAEKFADADFEDDIYVYNDFQRPYYFITKHFNNIIGIEDGYGSLSQQMKVHHFKGAYALVTPFLKKYYPEPLYRHRKVSRIISSCYFDDLPDYYYDKLQILDFKDIMERNKESFIQIMMKIFQLGDVEIEDEGILILTTPLSRVRYCDSIDNFLFYKKLIEKEKQNGKQIYIKPHPADSFVDYKLFEDEQVVVLPKQFPIELLEYKGIRFEKSISFGSTAIVDNLCSESITMYTGDNTPSDITSYIKEYVGKERLKLNVYVKLTGMSPDRYMNAFGFLRDKSSLETNVKFIVDRQKQEKYLNYFDPSNLNIRCREFIKMQHENGQVAYSSEAKELRIDNLKHCSYSFVATDCMDDYEIYRSIISEDKFDFFLLVDDRSTGFKSLDAIYKYTRERINFCTTFFNYTHAGQDNLSKRIMLGSGQVGDALSNHIRNRLWHCSARNFIDKDCENSIGEALFNRRDSVIHRAGLLLHEDNGEYLQIENGNIYYSEKLAWLQENCDDEDVLIRNILLLLKDYYDWATIVSPRSVRGLISNFIKSCELNEEVIIGIQNEFIEQLLKERQIEFSRTIYKEIEDFNYYKKALRRLKNSGKFYRSLRRDAISRKIRKLIKKYYIKNREENNV